MEKQFSNLLFGQEKILRKDLENYLTKAKVNFKNPLTQVDFEDQIKIHLKDDLEMTKKTHPYIFKTIEEIFSAFKIKDIRFRVFAKNKKDEEAIAIVSVGSQIIFSFFNDASNNLYTENELKYLLAHEIGHFILGHTDLPVEQFLINLISRTPETKAEEKLMKSDDWDYCLDAAYLTSQFVELNADRVGLLFCKDVESSLKCVLKATSGIMNKDTFFNTDSYVKQSEELFQLDEYFFLNDLRKSHPVPTLRVYALKQFSDMFLSKWDKKTDIFSYIDQNKLSESEAERKELLLKITPLKLFLDLYIT